MAEIRYELNSNTIPEPQCGFPCLAIILETYPGNEDLDLDNLIDGQYAYVNSDTELKKFVTKYFNDPATIESISLVDEFRLAFFSLSEMFSLSLQHTIKIGDNNVVL